jgi:Putative auto-transporter adhesin, head GIN domain
MRTKLAIIALSSFAISAACLGGAFALGGRQLGDANFNFDGFGLPRCEASASPAATAETRTLPWDGNSDRVAVAFPANTHYQAGSGDQLVVRGDPAIISHVRVHNGTVELDCHDGFMHFGREDRIDVTLPGRRTFRTFEMLGSGDMQLAGLSQQDAKLSLEGSGTIESDGKVDNLSLEIDGSGTIQSKGQSDDLHVEVNGSGKLGLADLAAKNANVDISGSGKVDVAPQDSLHVDISGSGTIYLHSEPKSIQTDISGSGKIIHANGTVEDRRERHARLEGQHERVVRITDAEIGNAVGDVVQEALANGDAPDPDQIHAAEAKLKERIRARVAQELAHADLGDDDDNGR